MSLRMLDDDANLRDLPCLIVALMVHGAILSTPLLKWTGALPPPEPPAVAVDFVTQAPMQPPPPVPLPAPPSPALAPVPAAVEREGVPHKGEGEFHAEKKLKPKGKVVAVKDQKGVTTIRARKVKLVVRAQETDEQRAATALRRAKLAAIQAENDRLRKEKLRAAEEAAAAAAQKRAEQARAAREAEVRAREEEQRRQQEAAEARARRRVEASRQLALMRDPDEKLSDAVADTPSAGPVAGTPGGRGGLEGALPSATMRAAKFRAGREAVYEAEAEGDSARAEKARGGGTGVDGGGLNWSLEGPAGSRRLLARPLPASPSWISERGLQLSVQVKFEVGPDGRVKPGAVIKRTSGFPEIDRSALDALKRWRFDAAPASAGPQTWGIVTFRFVMG